MVKGWIVEVTYLQGGRTSTDRYAVAIAEKEAAVSTLKRHIEIQATVSAQEVMSEATYYRLGLTPGKMLRLGK
jgi:hypothetical protein